MRRKPKPKGELVQVHVPDDDNVSIVIIKGKSSVVQSIAQALGGVMGRME